MSFTTPAFLLLFAVTCLLYFNLRRERQNLVVLMASLVFYGWWDWRFLFLIFATTAVDYICAIRIHEATSEKRRTAFLATALLINLGTLALFKYLDFFIQSASDVIRYVRRHAQPAAAPSGAASRHLVLHLPRAELHDRRLSATGRSRKGTT